VAEANNQDLAKFIVGQLRGAGHAAYLVGGCVRDLLLGRRPDDFDVATDAPPERILKLFPKAGEIGAHFGVVQVREEQATVEVATFRSDSQYVDGRHPETVRYESDPRKDALRRDFTINAMFLDPETGQVLDFVGGQRDLESGVVRTVGEARERFAEDHLRMLRAVRFAARLGFQVEEETMAAVRQLRDRIHLVSAERIRDELSRILTEGGARRGFELLYESGLLAEILPEVAAMRGVEQPPEFHPEGDVWTHTLIMLESMHEPTLTLALGLLLHDVGKPPTFQVTDRIRFNGHAELGAEMAVRIMNRLRFSSDEIRQVESLVANHLRFKDVRNMRESTLKRFLRMERFEEHLELHRLDCASSHGLLDNYHFVREKLAETPPDKLRPPRLLTGRDLIEAGYQPGPQFAKMLEAVETAQLESRVQSLEDALELIRSEFGPPRM
jgi:putative nucleotidyltransferase with HDIG domain